MTLTFQPILADVIDMLVKGIPIILFVLWLVGQALSERQKQAKPAPRQVARPVPPAQQPQRAATDIEDEIDAFLRRAAEKKGQPPPRREETVILVPPKEEASQASPPVRGRLAEARRQAAAPPRERRLSKPLSQQVVGTQAGGERQRSASRQAVAQKVPPAKRTTFEESISGPLSTPLSQRQSHLGAKVAQADDKMESHVQSVFQHQLGRLQHRETSPTQRASGSPIAESIAEMLKHPEGMRQMIVINEILRRPEV